MRLVPTQTTATALLAIAAALLLAAAQPACAQAQAPAPAKLLPQQSEIAFTSKQMGVPVSGQFGKFDAQIAFDPKHPETGKVQISIDTGSASIGDKDTDAEMKKPDWFSIAAFPKASFASTAIKPLGGNRYEVAGTLSLKGTSKPVVVPVMLAQSGSNATASGSFSIKRNDFKIGAGEWADPTMVADEVLVKFKLALAGLPTP